MAKFNEDIPDLPIALQDQFIGLVQQSDKSKLMAFYANSDITELAARIDSVRQ